jgi:transcriptional regulator with XRE-family HTH domain
MDQGGLVGVMDPLTLGQTIAREREARGWSLRDLGERAGVSHTQVWKIESGHSPNASMSTIRALVRALGLDLEAVLGEHDAENRPVSTEQSKRLAHIQRITDIVPVDRLEDMESLMRVWVKTSPEDALMIETIIRTIASNRRTQTSARIANLVSDVKSRSVPLVREDDDDDDDYSEPLEHAIENNGTRYDLSRGDT